MSPPLTGEVTPVKSTNKQKRFMITFIMAAKLET